ncbi:MAG: hypothetical protein HQK57_10690 [Deltaproteobacteria bacterium]|nr:hypothetical protein [Deltaproteobacteria bacterium]
MNELWDILKFMGIAVALTVMAGGMVLLIRKRAKFIYRGVYFIATSAVYFMAVFYTAHYIFHGYK